MITEVGYWPLLLSEHQFLAWSRDQRSSISLLEASPRISFTPAINYSPLPYRVTSSYKYCGIWVVLPEPVSPSIMSIWCSAMAASKSSRYGKIGRLRRTSWIDNFLSSAWDSSGFSSWHRGSRVRRASLDQQELVESLWFYISYPWIKLIPQAECGRHRRSMVFTCQSCQAQSFVLLNNNSETIYLIPLIDSIEILS